MSRLFEVNTNKGTFYLFPHEMKKLDLALSMLEKADMMRMKPVSMGRHRHVTYGEAMLGFCLSSLVYYTATQMKTMQQILLLEDKANNILGHLGYFKSAMDRMAFILECKERNENGKRHRMEQAEGEFKPARIVKTACTTR